MLQALWSLFAKKALGGLLFIWLFGIVSLCAGLPFGLHFWPAHATQLTPMAWLVIVASALAHLAYMLVLQKAYRAADFSVVYPLARGASPLFSVLDAIVLLGETPSMRALHLSPQESDRAAPPSSWWRTPGQKSSLASSIPVQLSMR